MQLLYLVECQGFCKIGVAYDIRRRMAELSTGNPFELNLLATYGYNNAQVVEGALHQKFTEKRVRGEWFKFGETDIQLFHGLCQALGGEAIPVIRYVEESEIETADDETLLAQLEEQKRREELNLKIVELFKQGLSQRQIEHKLFGYIGGTAANTVSAVVKKFKETTHEANN